MILCRVIGNSVSTVKHAHHAFDVDRPGKDSFEHRQAGAAEVLVSSPEGEQAVFAVGGQELLTAASPVTRRGKCSERGRALRKC